MQKHPNTWKCGNRTWVAGKGFLISTSKPTKHVAVKYLTKHTPYVYLSFTSFFYLCSKKKQIHCTYMWWHKDVEVQRDEDRVATRLPRL